MEKKVSKAFLEKQKVVAEIQKLATESKSMIAVDYRGVTVSEITKMRVNFRKSGVVYRVYKTNLVRIALNNMGVKTLDEKLTGTLGFAFSQKDEIAATKIIKDANLKDKMVFKFGLLGTSVLDAAGVESLASMPSKETLIAQLLGLLNMGVRNIATVINAVPRNLAVVIGERAKQVS